MYIASYSKNSILRLALDYQNPSVTSGFVSYRGTNNLIAERGSFPWLPGLAPAYNKTWSGVDLWSGALEWSGFWSGFLEWRYLEK